MTETYMLTGSELITELSNGGLDAEWASLGGGLEGIHVGPHRSPCEGCGVVSPMAEDGRTCVITDGFGGESRESEPLTGGGVGFYDGGGWVADSSAWLSAGADDPTATVAGLVGVVRSWIYDGVVPDGLVDGR